MPEHYNWKRFWSPLGSPITLADRGFLIDPEGEYAPYVPDRLLPLEKIPTARCLILLGEPGMGKSVALENYRKECTPSYEAAGDAVFSLNLNRFTSDAFLVQSLFQHPILAAWRTGSGALHLFLDSFDECLIRINTLVNLLVAELEQLPLDRLLLRIICRTAAWPSLLDNELQRLFGDEVVMCELAPLRRRDVVEAAAQCQVSSEAFLEEIRRRELAGLAMKPVTLRFLLNAFRQNGAFPDSQAELYRQGCLLLAAEDNQSRRAAGLHGQLSPAQRFAVAGRVAAVTVYCGFPAVSLQLDDGSLPQGALPLQELVGGTETVAGSSFEVTEAAVREVLDTGLFSARGIELLGFAHQTYAEFLAARYLCDRRVGSEQALPLVTHQTDETGRVVPQLQETAAWLASLQPPVFDHIVKRDPQALLGSDVATMSTQSRAALVEALLKLFDAEQLIDDQHEHRQRYRRLSHPGLAQQLTPYIQDRNKNAIVRRVAIDIAEACAVTALEDVLIGVVLDQNDGHPTRVQAAYAISRIGGRAAKTKLRPCALGQAGEDPDDELKGVALRTLWPEHLTADVIFAALTEPKQCGFHGSYLIFLSQLLPDNLLASDLPIALKWVALQPGDRELETPYPHLLRQILNLAWENVDEPAVLQEYAPVVVERLQHYLPIPGLERSIADAGEHQRRRRQLAQVVIPQLLARGYQPEALVFTLAPLLFRDDVAWLLVWMQRAETAELQGFLARVVQTVYCTGDLETLDLILQARETCAVLRNVFAPLLDPVDLHSELAESLRQEYRRQMAWEERRDERHRPQGPRPAERVCRCLDRFEAGNLDAWWQLNLELTLKEGDTHYLNELEADIRVLPGWEQADPATRVRILSAAKSYVTRAAPQPEKWMGTSTIHRPDFAGYRALLLLWEEDRAYLDSLSPGAWTKWVGVILGYPIPHGVALEVDHDGLIGAAYAQAPDEFIRVLPTQIQQENRNQRFLTVHRKLEVFLDERLAAMLLAQVQAEQLKTAGVKDLLELLVSAGYEQAIVHSLSLVAAPLPQHFPQRARALMVAGILLNAAPARGWAAVWTAMQSDDVFGRVLMTRIAHHNDTDHPAAFAAYLTESQLADLYEWLVRTYPPSRDPQEDGVHVISPRESIADFRNGLLAQLQRRGTQEAVSAIYRLAVALPDQRWLKWNAVAARRIALQRTWIPPRPTDLLRIVRDSDAWLVDSGGQLLGVVLQSLQRLSSALQAETPAAPDLWDEIRKGVFRPKDELALSNYVARHLRKDIHERGIVVNREVEIRRGEGVAEGERTDIHVDAIKPGARSGSFDVVTVTVELKGCWNKGLKKDLVGQLRDRYLTNTTCCHGLYLIGWFHCDQWDHKDGRRKKSPKMTLEEAQQFFDQQAANASGDDVTIRAYVLNAALR